MSANKYRPHIVVIPEDDANRELAIGFRLHHAIFTKAIAILTPAGGWNEVMNVFQKEYIQYLNNYRNAYVVLLLDFDEKEDRGEVCEKDIPNDLKERVFLVGSRDEPEKVRAVLGEKLVQIGESLAEECHKEKYIRWTSEHFDHNSAERIRLASAVRSIIFR